MQRFGSVWAGLYGGLLLMLQACQSAAPPVSPRADEQPAQATLPEARYQVVQPTLEQQDEQGHLLWRLEAQALQGQSAGEQAEGTLVQVRGWLYRQGKPVLQLRAQYARAHSETREVEAWGTVQATSTINHAQLQAERILWKARDDRIIATGSVTIRWGDLVIQDERLVLDTALQRAWGGE
jgi:LPS export ABC transporter protein LptC